MKHAPSRRATRTDRIEQEIEAALQPGSFIKYGAAWPFVEGLERVGKATTAAARAGEHQRDPAYLRRRAAEILRVILAEQRNVGAYAALCEATVLSPADCLALAKMLQVRRKPAELEMKDSSSSASHDLGGLKSELLLKLGHRDAALEAAWSGFRAHPNTYSYADLMRYVPKTDRAAWHEKAIDAAAGADLHSLIELLLETKEIDRLVVRLRKASDEELEGITHYATEPVARKLAKSHPDVAGKVYRALGMRILKAKKSKYYDAALENFAEARRCYERAGAGEIWTSLVEKIRAEHHR